MNKRKVDDLLKNAYEVLNSAGIAKDGVISSAFRGQVASFGASIATGSLLSAVAFYSNDGNAEIPRHKLMDAIHLLVKEKEDTKTLFEWVKKQKDDQKSKEDVLNAAIALKLAMNIYKIEKKGELEDAKT